MTKEKEKKSAKEQLLLEASRLGDLKQLDSILGQFQQHKAKKKSNPLASLRKTVGPNSIRDPVTGFTCLHHAALNGHAECVKLILSHGARMNSVDYKGSSALHLAAWAGNLDVVRTLLNYRCASRSPSSSSASPAKETAGQEGDRDNSSSPAAAKHQQEAADINLCNNDNQTPLSLAAQFGHDEVVSELLKHSANVHLRNNHFESPLDLACLNGRLQTVQLLLNSTPNLVADLRKSKSSVVLRAEPPYRQNSRLNHESCPPSSLAAIASTTSASQQQKSTSDNAAQATSTRITPNGGGGGGGGHSRRASGSGWSSLLRGSRRDSGSAASQQVASVANQSSSPSSGKRPAAAAAASSVMQLRQYQSYDAASASASSSPLMQQQHQVALSGWPADNLVERLLDHSPLHYAVRRGHSDVVCLLLKTYAANILQITSLGSVLHEIALNNGKHSDVMRLIFSHISEQVQQEQQAARQTSQLHQAQGESFNGNNQQQQDACGLLEQFLSLRNAQQRTVFEVLSEINNRSAQEIKRLIYEYSEQIQRFTGHQQQDASNQHQKSNTNLANFEMMNVMLRNQQHYPNQMQATDLRQIETFATMKRVPKKQRSAIVETTNEFTSRMGGGGGSGNLMMANMQQANQLPFSGTQTIDRRRVGASRQFVDFAPNMSDHNYQPQLGHRPATSGSQQQLSFRNNNNNNNDNGNHNNNINQQQAMSQLLQQQQQQRVPLHPLQQLQQNSPMMTRSVSNLSSAQLPMHRGQQNAGARENDDYNAIMWHHWLASRGHQLPMPTSGAGSGANFIAEPRRPAVDADARRRRSKSRDLGSLLQESAELMRNANCENPSGQMATSMQAAAGQLQPMSWADGATNDRLDASAVANAAHLVRSQTDCSHLMGRFFGDQSSLTERNRMLLMSSNLKQQQQHPLDVAESRSQHQAAVALHHQLLGAAGGNLDRKTINRHYHVYEHEFYPPRLLPQQQQVAEHHHSSGSSVSYPIGQRQQQVVGKQSAAIAIVPPFGRQGDQKSSVGSGFGVGGGSFMGSGGDASAGNRNKESTQSIRSTDSRLSLNLETQMQAANYQQQQQQQHQSQLRHQDPSSGQFESTQQQMDRFLGRHSRKSAIPQAASFDLNHLQQNDGNNSSSSDYANENSSLSRSSRCQSVMGQKRKDLIELQQKLVLGQGNSNMQAQIDLLPNSQSLESHLSEPYLFESTRRALIKDFDRMIGQELLNRDHTSIIGNQSVASSIGKPTKLTGVSLDMDKYGDNLIVSGMSVPDEQPKRRSLNQKRMSQGSRTSRESQDELKNKAIQISRSVSNGTQTSSSPSASSVASSTSSITSKSMKQQKQKSTVIYDLPSAPTSQLSSQEKLNTQQLVSRQATSGGNKPAVPGRTSITEPPRERPPPPPALSTPLQVLASNDHPSNSIDSCSSNSNNSNISSGGSTQLISGKDSKTRSGGLLLKMASNASTSSSGSQTSFRRFPVAGGRREPGLSNMVPLLVGNDPDSGICTSNSPASMSHDSEDLLETNNQRQATILTQMRPEPSPQDSIGKPTNSSLVINQQPAGHPPPPPSPHTAQQCIEEALMPLDKPFEAINRATSPLSATSANDIDPVDRWLATEDDIAQPEADYENCISLQEQLRKVAEGESMEQLNKQGNSLHANESDDGDYAASLSPASMCNGAAGPINKVAAPSPETDDSPKLECDRASPIEIKGKELKLQVVIGDADDHAVEGEQVFYINPSELRKIATDRRKNHADAESLTDEDLCATIDKDSGYIRFTLRKRKNESIDESSQRTANSPSSSIDHSLAKESNRTSTSTKKSRMNPSDNKQQVTFKPNKLEAAKVKNWFASNLVGLTDYADILIAHGFDNLQFMNDDRLVNDANLKAIGISDESHRMLIIHRVHNQIEQSPIEDLVKSLVVEGQASLLKVTEVLRMDCLLVEKKAYQKMIESVADVEAQKVNLTENLPLGYSSRLNLALDYIAKIIKPQEKPRQEATVQHLSKQISTESSEVEMDASQASATSSSSKESVRSIVMLQPQQPVQKPIQQQEQPANQAFKATEKSVIELGKAPRAEPELDVDEAPKPEAKVNERPEATQITLADKVSADSERKITALVTRSSSGCGSLVSEVARKLEAAAGQNNGPIKLRPVAAARKISGPPSSNKLASDQVKIETTKAATTKPEVEKDSIKVSPIRDRDKRKMSPIKPAMSVRQTAAMFAPVKSTGWSKENIEPCKPEVPRLNAGSRLLATRMIYEQANETEINKQQVAMSRPLKPPPPVKPAKLAIASRVQ